MLQGGCANHGARKGVRKVEDSLQSVGERRDNDRESGRSWLSVGCIITRCSSETDISTELQRCGRDQKDKLQSSICSLFSWSGECVALVGRNCWVEALLLDSVFEIILYLYDYSGSHLNCTRTQTASLKSINCSACCLLLYTRADPIIQIHLT